MNILILIFFLLSAHAHAASCCGGGGGSGTLILGDHKTIFGFSVTSAQTIGETDVDGQAVFRRPENRDSSVTSSFSATRLLGSFTQLGVMIPYVQRTRQMEGRSESGTGLGDVSAFGAYEAWPIKTFSNWVPRGFLLGQIDSPTSPSVHDSSTRFGEDIRGSGFWKLSTGVLFARHWVGWDASLRSELRFSVPRSFLRSGGSSYLVSPGPSWDTLLTAGYSPKKIQALRFGSGFGPSYQSAKVYSDSGSSRETLLWNSLFTVSYMLSSLASVQVYLSDQTLFGPSYNASLTRSLGLNLEIRESL